MDDHVSRPAGGDSVRCQPQTENLDWRLLTNKPKDRALILYCQVVWLSGDDLWFEAIRVQPLHHLHGTNSPAAGTTSTSCEHALPVAPAQQATPTGARDSCPRAHPSGPPSQAKTNPKQNRGQPKTNTAPGVTGPPRSAQPSPAPGWLASCGPGHPPGCRSRQGRSGSGRLPPQPWRCSWGWAGRG